MPIQQMMLGSGGSSKTYIDDVFANTLWTGDGSSTRSITTGIDMSGEGGMVWLKNRHQQVDWVIGGTGVGDNNHLASNTDGTKSSSASKFKSLTSTGFQIGDDQEVNQNTARFVGNSFRKASGFFDVVNYTGNATSTQNISHSLGCVPGVIMVKNLDSADDWMVYHCKANGGRNTGKGYDLKLNGSYARNANANVWNDTAPTKTQFTVGNDNLSNRNGDSFVAYLFAGGESDASTATSVDLNTKGYLSVPGSSDFAFGTGAYTIEMWVYIVSCVDYTSLFEGRPNSSNGAYLSIPLFGNRQIGLYKSVTASNDWYIAPSAATTIPHEQWTHIAVVREGTGSNQTKMYFNGEKVAQGTDDEDYDQNQGIIIGRHAWSGDKNLVGSVSNYRVVKGTAVYTADFRPPTEPLTNITNTKLLCCQGSSVTDATVIPTGSISSLCKDASNTFAQASTSSPFVDAECFKFGEDGDQSIIATGSFRGNGSSDGPVVYLGWEPTFFLAKRTVSSSASNWRYYDSMRGVGTQVDSGTKGLFPNLTQDELAYTNRVQFDPTGFQIKNSSEHINYDGDTYTYIAIRRADGYVGKPVEAGTEVFSMNSGSASGAPLFDSTCIVDFQMVRGITSSANWETGARKLQRNQVYANTSGTQTEIDPSGWMYDYMDGWHSNSGGISNYMCWMWQRHKGFAVRCYEGNGTAGRSISHDMNQAPEMIWCKARGSSYDWFCWHKDLNNGTNAINWYIKLNDANAPTSNTDVYGSSASIVPTSIDWTVGSNAGVNENGTDFLAMLFSSVSGISKVGSYTGNGNSSGPTVTVGFQPRMVIIRRTDSGDSWFIFDTARGVNNSGADQLLKINSDAAQTSTDRLSFGSDDFTLTSTDGGVNANNGKYIYYAHA